MKILDFRLCGIRCFKDTGDISLHPKCNLFVGRNNAGKSTLLRGILDLQGFGFQDSDIRPHSGRNSFLTASFDLRNQQIATHTNFSTLQGIARATRILRGEPPHYPNFSQTILQNNRHPLFMVQRPQHAIVPFLARRKSAQYSHDITLPSQQRIDGTLSNLNSRIDLLIPTNHPNHKKFIEAVDDILDLPIATASSASGKQAGYYFDEHSFVPIEQMGDGVAEMLAMIVELCTESDKIFILEEPEISIHPGGLKKLAKLIRFASERNQFLIATHSNVIVRELGGTGDGKVFRCTEMVLHMIVPQKLKR